MAGVLGLLVVVAIAVAVARVAVRAVVALLPVALVVGVIGLVAVVLCDDAGDNQICESQTVVEHVKEHAEEQIEKQVEDRVETIENHIEKVRDGVQQKFHQQMRSMTRQKSGVNLEDILPELDSAISVVVWAYSVATGDYNFKPLITSANDYEGHSERSAHYSGAAIDFRIKDMGSLEERRELVDLIREELGERFVVLHEDIGKSNEHLHVQLRRGTYERNVVWK